MESEMATMLGYLSQNMQAAAVSSNGVSGRKWAKKENRKSREWQEKMYHQQVNDTKSLTDWEWNNFNSPRAKMIAAKMAGINPYDYVTNGQGQQTVSAPSFSGDYGDIAAATDTSSGVEAARMASDAIPKAIQMRNLNLTNDQIDLQNKAIEQDVISKGIQNKSAQADLDLKIMQNNWWMSSFDKRNKASSFVPDGVNNWVAERLGSLNMNSQNVRSSYNAVNDFLYSNPSDYQVKRFIRASVFSPVLQNRLSSAQLDNLYKDLEVKTANIRNINADSIIKEFEAGLRERGITGDLTKDAINALKQGIDSIGNSFSLNPYFKRANDWIKRYTGLPLF